MRLFFFSVWSGIYSIFSRNLCFSIHTCPDTIISDMMNTATGYTQLSVCNKTGSMQAEIWGIKVVLDSIRHIAGKRKDKGKFTIKGNGEKMTIQIPTNAFIVIRNTKRKRLIFQTLLSTIHIPITSAAISGKMISFSSRPSAIPIISRIINSA